MSHKCLNKELHEDMQNLHLQDNEDGDDRVSFEESGRCDNFLKLGEWILQMQDGDIKKNDFLNLEHCLLTNPHALDYYIEFMWISAGLHELFNEKQAVLT